MVLRSDGTGGAHAGGDSAAIVRGTALYVAHCQPCHSTLVNARPLAGVPSHGAAGHTWGHPDSTILRIILDGRPPLPSTRLADSAAPTMPAWRGRLSPADAEAILTYIKSSWTDEQHAVREGWYGCRRDGVVTC